MNDDKPSVAIAGATGFIGRALRRALANDYRVIGLTRGEPPDASVEWRRCDLYSLLDAERGLAGCRYAIYLVHSMLPSARLTQGSFADLDLVLADNFARAAARCGVEHIVYVGALSPRDGALPQHIESRLEVERTLAAYGTRVTALRAGLVVGAGGSWLDVLTRLVRRLPVLIMPRWTRSATQPIALADVVRAVERALSDPRSAGSFDIGGPDVVTYRGVMERIARVLGVRRPMLDVPFFMTGISTLWIALVTGAPIAFVRPFVRSLRCHMTVGDNPLQRWLSPRALGLDESLRRAIEGEHEEPRVLVASRDRQRLREARTVRSVQRLPRPPGRSARFVAEEYVRWLPSATLPGLRCVTDGPTVRFHVWPLKKPLLVLTLSCERSTEDRALFYIDGGLLARTDGARRGRFEMRITADGAHVLAAVHDFRPTLPWPIYNATQALVHLAVMKLFGRHLARLGASQRAMLPARSD